MSADPQNRDFFVVGGAMGFNTASYVRRSADDELLHLTRSGKFCYVLASRQMGKSSLMARTNHQLRAEGIRTVIIDLTNIGAAEVTADQWYLSFLTEIELQLQLSVDPISWWEERSHLSIVHRFTNFLRDVILTEIDTQIVIFVDEIDTTLKLGFTDDFFAAIRAIYNARAEDARFKRLSFVLLGVATPSDLIKDPVRTPFNTGQGIKLRDFNRAEAKVLEEGLERIHPKQGKDIFDRIFYWTDGHPYLTQKLCQATAEEKAKMWTTRSWVDDLVRKIFFSEENNKQSDLQLIEGRILGSPLRDKLIALYSRIYHERQVPEDEQSLEQARLKLLGLVRVKHGYLKVRNKIYKQAFDEQWIKDNTPKNWPRRIAAIALVLLCLSVIVNLVGFFLLSPDEPTNQDRAAEYTATIIESNNPQERLIAFAQFFGLPEEFKGQALNLYNELPLSEKIALFEGELTGLESELITVVRNVYIPSTPEPRTNTLLLEAMRSALERAGTGETVLANEITRWLEGRKAVDNGDFLSANSAYYVAIDLRRNNLNPATLFEQAQVLSQLDRNQNALNHFEAVADLREDWTAAIQKEIMENNKLYDLVWAIPEEYPTLKTLLPIPTPTPTNTPIPPTPTEIPSPTPTFTPAPAPLGVFRDFETPIIWLRDRAITGAFERTTTQAYTGDYSGELTYDFAGVDGDHVLFSSPQLLGGQPNQITAWVNGDGSGHYLILLIRDNQDEKWQFSFGEINHTGWEKMTAYFDISLPWPTTRVDGPGNGILDYPITFDWLALAYKVNTSNDSPRTGTIYIDDLASVRGSLPIPTPAPTATSTPIVRGDTIIHFQSDRTVIEEGQCVNLNWHVENARGVYLQGRPESGINSQEECPTVTTTYELSVTLPDWDRSTSKVTITVLPKFTPTPEPTFTPRPTIPLTYDTVIILTEPAPDVGVTRASNLYWEWSGEPLRANEYFDVRVYTSYEDYQAALNPVATMAVVTQTFTDVYDHSRLNCDQTYFWSVRVSEAESITPDGVSGFVGPRSPDSKPRRFVWQGSC